MMKTLIVGGGLAGIALSERLLSNEIPFELMCERDKPSSTNVATGMFNPVVFRRLNLSWMIDELLPEMRSYIVRLEALLNTQLIQDISIARHLPNEAYTKLWRDRAALDEFKPYIESPHKTVGLVKNAGLVDCQKLQESFLTLLANKNQLINEKLDFSKLEVSGDFPTYRGVAYERVIFCEGPFAVENPYFNWLPFKLCKGEWITIQTSAELTSDIINNKINIIPIGYCRYRISSTYSWSEIDWKPSDQGKQTLIEHFNNLYDVEFDIIDHRAGIRPTVADRRPYLGEHPDSKRLFIFNGLGSKGVTLAPYFAKHLTEHIFEGTPLMEEVDIKRHIKRFEQGANPD